MFVLIKSRTSVKIGHVGSKTRSLGQILELPCVLSRGHNFSPIIMKLRQNVCLDEILDKCENGHVGSKTWSLGQMLEKPCVGSSGHQVKPFFTEHGSKLY